MRIIAHDPKAMMAALNVPIEQATGPMLIGLAVIANENIPPGVYVLDADGTLTAGEYEAGALVRCGWRKPQP